MVVSDQLDGQFMRTRLYIVKYSGLPVNHLVGQFGIRGIAIQPDVIVPLSCFCLHVLTEV